jgi:hypothetical protein
MATEVQALDADSIVQRIANEVRDHPEARALLLRSLLSEDLITLPAKYDQIAEGVAANTSAIAQLTERMDQLTERIDRLTTTVGDLVTAQRQMHQDIGSIKGWGLELISSRRLHEYSKVMNMRRLSEIEHRVILHQAEEACDKELITEAELYKVASADAYFYGWSRKIKANAYLLAQISYTIDPEDVTRAVEQSELLKRITGEPVFPVVAGTHLTPRGEVEAGRHGDVPYVRISNGKWLRS